MEMQTITVDERGDELTAQAIIPATAPTAAPSIAPDGTPGDLDEFRVGAPREIAGLLNRLCDAEVELSLASAQGRAVCGTVWTLDAARGSLGFKVDPDAPALQHLLECREVTVTGHLDAVKIQFEVRHLVLVHGAEATVLSCTLPTELFRFQRRNAYRVQPALRSSPVAHLRHGDIAEMQLTLRVLDISIGGCALFLPDDVPQMQPGGVLNRVQIDLDADTRFHVNLRLQHITSLDANAHGVRLGCEFEGTDANAQRSLQRFIDQTQKRAKPFAAG